MKSTRPLPHREPVDPQRPCNPRSQTPTPERVTSPTRGLAGKSSSDRETWRIWVGSAPSLGPADFQRFRVRREPPLTIGSGFPTTPRSEDRLRTGNLEPFGDNPGDGHLTEHDGHHVGATLCCNLSPGDRHLLVTVFCRRHPLSHSSGPYPAEGDHPSDRVPMCDTPPRFYPPAVVPSGSGPDLHTNSGVTTQSPTEAMGQVFERPLGADQTTVRSRCHVLPRQKSARSCTVAGCRESP